jgi:hypothetical protein
MNRALFYMTDDAPVVPISTAGPKPTPTHATDTGDMAFLLSPAGNFRLVYVRVHFSGGEEGDVADLVISLKSAAGDEYNVVLFTYRARGMGRDVNLALQSNETANPSPWNFKSGDQLLFSWVNPNPSALTWGIEVGTAS